MKIDIFKELAGIKLPTMSKKWPQQTKQLVTQRILQRRLQKLTATPIQVIKGVAPLSPILVAMTQQQQGGSGTIPKEEAAIIRARQIKQQTTMLRKARQAKLG